MERPSQHLKIIVASTLIALIILIGCGVVASLWWPQHWNTTLLSLLISIIGSLLGVLVAVLAAIFIVERYLERRRRERELMVVLEEEKYRRMWQHYTASAGTGVSYYIVHICLFLTCGKEVYARINGLDEKSFPDSLHEFIDWFQEEIREQLDNDVNPMFQPSSLNSHSYSNKQFVDKITRAFNESFNSEIIVCPGDMLSLVRLFRRLNTYLKDQIFLFQPFMTRNYGAAVAMVDLARELDDLRRFIKRFVSDVPEDWTPTELKLNTDLVLKYRKLGICALDVVHMIWAGRQDIVRISGDNSIYKF